MIGGKANQQLSEIKLEMFYSNPETCNGVLIDFLNWIRRLGLSASNSSWEELCSRLWKSKPVSL